MTTIEFEAMRSAPERDVAWDWFAHVFDANTRYPVRIMIDGLALLRSNAKPSAAVVEAMYRRELETLAKHGKLLPTGRRPDGSAQVNFVLFVNDGDMHAVRSGDIVIDGVCEKLVELARR